MGAEVMHGNDDAKPNYELSVSKTTKPNDHLIATASRFPTLDTHQAAVATL